MAADAPPGRVAAPAKGVGPAHALLDQEVIEQPHRDKPLLQGCVGQPNPRVQRYYIGSPAAGTGGQFSDKRRHLRPVGAERVDAVALTNLQVLGQPSGVGVDRPRSTS